MENGIKEENSEKGEELKPAENTSKPESSKEIDSTITSNNIQPSEISQKENNEYYRSKKEEIKNSFNNKDNSQNKVENNNKPLEQQILEEYDSDNSALSNSDISDNETDSIKTRTSTNKKMDIKTFYKQNRQYFIMNSGGTPIYSRYGDEIIFNSLFATFSAIITKFTVFNGGDNENLNYIKNEFSLIVFLKKGKIFLIAVSNKNDSVSLLYNQLEILYHQLLSIITNDRMHALEEKPSTCAKFILESNPLFEQLIEYTTHNLVLILKAYQVLPIDNRNKLNEICSKNRGEALFTGLLSANDKEIIAMNKSSVIELKYLDMILIQCLIMLKTISEEKELWLPICLPGISADGLLQLYYNYDPSNPYGILYITEKQENTSMSSFTESSQKIYDEIKEKGLLPAIEKALETKKNADNIKEEILNNPQEINVEALKEFIKTTFSSKNAKNKSNSFYPNEIIQKNPSFTEAYKTFTTSMISPSLTNNLGNININNITSNTKLISIGKIVCKQNTKNDPFLKLNYGIINHRIYSQYFSVNIHSYEYLTKEEKYIMKSYIKLYDYYVSFKNLSNENHFLHIEKDNKFSHGIYVTETYIILGTFNVFKPTNEIYEVLKDLVKIAKQNENNLFVSLKQG